jgi:hypothetical protein
MSSVLMGKMDDIPKTSKAERKRVLIIAEGALNGLNQVIEEAELVKSWIKRELLKDGIVK